MATIVQNCLPSRPFTQRERCRLRRRCATRQKGNRYTLLFVDPKGLPNIDWERKVDGHQRLFEVDGKPKVFTHGDMEVTVRLVLFTDDRGKAPEGSYKQYWQDNVKRMCREAFGV
jgi:hypothetical protein